MWESRYGAGVSTRAPDEASQVRTLHLAEGVLIGLRHCRGEVALGELADAARSAGLSCYELAAALVSVAAGEKPRDGEASSMTLARQRWGALLGWQV